MNLALTVLWPAVGLSFALTAGAQSLGEIARQEAERRAAVTSPAEVYTNSSLIPDFTDPTTADPSSERPISSTRTVADSSQGASELVEGVAPPQVDPIVRAVKGEDYWRAEARARRRRLDAHRTRVTALEAGLSGLASADSPEATREREVTRLALLRARSDLASIEQEWLDFEAVARAKNVPPAWIQ